MSAYADVSDLIADRANWLRVEAVRNKHGSYDVVLRLDGSYAIKSDAKDMANYFKGQIEPLLVQAGLGNRCTDWA